MSDPGLFEYSPGEIDDDDDEEVFISMYEIGAKPEDIPNAKTRKLYSAWLEKRDNESE